MMKIKRRRIGILLALLLVLQLGVMHGVYADTTNDSESSSTWNYSLTLLWSDGSSEKEDATTSRAHLAPTYDLGISVQKVYPERALEVRIPYTLFQLKDDHGYVEMTSIGIGPEDNKKADSPFTYYIDDKETDGVGDDEIVIYNYKELNTSSLTTISVAYEYDPSFAADYSAAAITAKGSGQHEGQDSSEAIESEPITYRLDSGIELQTPGDNFQKVTGTDIRAWSDSSVLKNFSSSKPANFDTENYHYVLYSFEDIATFTNQDTDVTVNFTPDKGGEVLYAGIEYVTNNYLNEKFDTMNLSSDGSTATYSVDIDEIGYKGDHLGQYEFTPSFYALVAFPKGSAPSSGTGQTTLIYDYTLGIEATFTAADQHDGNKENDDDFESVTVTNQHTQHYHDTVSSYTGSIYFGKKEPHALAGSYFANATIDALRAETDAIAPFYAFQGTFGFNFTEGYRMELLDDAVYLSYTADGSTSERVRLEEGEYYFTNNTRVNIRYQNLDASGEIVNTVPQGAFKLQGATADGEWEDISSFQLSNPTSQPKNAYYAEAGLFGSGNVIGECYRDIMVPAEKQYTKLRVLTPDGMTDYVGIRLEANVAIKYDAPIVQEYLAKENLSTINVTNISTNKTYLKDDNDEEYVDNTSEGKINSVADEVGLYDDETKGKYFYHYNADVSLGKLNVPNNLQKSFQNTEYDSGQQEVRSTVSLYAVTTYTQNANMMSVSEKFKDLVSWNDVVFYDLLPYGWHYDDSREASFGRRTTYPNSLSVDVDVVANFNDTGRDLVIATVKNTSDTKNMNGNSSQITLDLPVRAPYEEIASGVSYTNIAAIQREDGASVSQGKPSNTEGFEDLSAALQEGGGNTLYSRANITPVFTDSFTSGASKTVRGDSETYVRSDTTSLGNTYSWRLRLNSDGTRGKVSNLKFVDVLESAGDADSTWKGTFDHVDLSFAKLVGAEPTVYYSTSTDLDHNADSYDWDDWQLEEPSDKSTITGILIDFGDFVMDADTAGKMYVDIYMTAPTTFEAGKLKAVNDFSYESVVTTSGAGTSSAMRSFNHVNSAEISYKVGSVIVHYEDEDGNTLQDDVMDEEDAATGHKYDTTDNKPDRITLDDGRIYEIVPSKTRGEETGSVVEGTTEVTYVYREVKGNVIVHYQDVDGNTIQDSITDTEDSSVGTPYDTTDNMPSKITYEGKTYVLVPSRTIGNETGSVVEGTTEVTYVYQLQGSDSGEDDGEDDSDDDIEEPNSDSDDRSSDDSDSLDDDSSLERSEPDTGDGNAVGFYGGILLVAAIGLALVIGKRRKSNR